MKKAVLIADSGGSKTDWCLIDEIGNKTYFETDSYHPHLLNEEWIEAKQLFWKQYTEVYDLNVHFFGAGCLNEKNKVAIKNAFEKWGIDSLLVESDLLGASKACYGNENGLIGIMGTGSVVAEIKSNTVFKMYGGFGHILGDEGSGYFFGKMLLQQYLKDAFSKQTNIEIENIIGSKNKVVSEVYGMNGKKYISSLSALFSGSNNSEILEIHSRNIQLFLDLYLPADNSDRTISFVGSYAFYCSEFLQKSLSNKGWKVGKILKKPIEQLSENILGNTF